MTPTINMIQPTSNAGNDGARSSIGREPVISLPTKRLFALLIASAFLIAGGWAAAIAIGPWSSPEFTAGMIGIGTTSAMILAGLMVMTPWKSRPMGDWTVMWMAATVFRLLGTPTVLYLLYSAASVGGSALAVKPLVLSVSLTYLFMVLVEAGTIASHVRRLLPSP